MPVMSAAERANEVATELTGPPMSPSVIAAFADAIRAAESDACKELAKEIERLREAIKVVVETFEKDEAQGYRSRDRRYAIDILRTVLPR
jgi:hypothetical protein